MSIVNQWKKFLDNIEEICGNINERDFALPKSETIQLLGEVLNRLREDDAIEAVSSAVQEMDRNEDELIKKWFEKELQLFNMAVEEDPETSDEADSQKSKGRLGQAKTLKDSLGKLFKLRPWLQKILDILNELLSLIRP